MNSIPLNRALLCSECRTVSDSPQGCPKCGSSALFGLWRFIPNCENSAIKLTTDPIPRDVIELERMVKF